MLVRGAPLIGANAAFGLWLAMRVDASDAALEAAYRRLLATRPTAVNLRWALERVDAQARTAKPGDRYEAALACAESLQDLERASCAAIATHGLRLLESRLEPGRPLRVLTHCNAGWLATGAWGTALAPLYAAHDAGIPLHVWVDETRPRNQGARLTAWELGQAGIDCTVIADSNAGHLMQHGEVDLCLVGSDRTTARGDVCNKIGTYLKALAAHDNGVPFYAALPCSTIDWQAQDGLRDIPIEQRSADELRLADGVDGQGVPTQLAILPATVAVRNDAFDVTPARLVSGLICEHGVFAAEPGDLARLRRIIDGAQPAQRESA
jgi:methylthioribose-1-phosphate isomerase